jgi:hypothetical protein
MNDWIFKGFETPISLWIVLVVLAVAVSLSIWSYYHVRVTKLQRVSLVTLRILAFLAIVLVLLNPVVQRIGTEVVRNRLPVLFDNSLSAGVTVGYYNGSESYASARSVLNRIDTSTVQLLPFSFAEEIVPTHRDSLDLSGRETDIARALGTISELERDASAVILFTDGQYNAGRDPRFVVDRMSQPIFVIGIGDSSRTRDILIQNVVHPDIAYKDTRVPIEVMIANDGFTGQATTVSLRSGDQLIDSKPVIFRSDRSVQVVTFELPVDTEGLRQYEAVVEPLQDEWTPRNNRVRFTIDVLDNRLRILLLSFEVHPDVKVVQNLLEMDESIFSRSLTWIGGDRFINGPLPASADTLDLIFLYGFPHNGIPQRLLDQVVSLISGTSYVLAASPLFDPALAMRRLEGSIPLAMPPVNSPFEVGIMLNQASREHPILNYEHPEYERAPRLFGHIRNLRPSPGAEVLMSANFRGAVVDAPLLTVRTVGSRRAAVLNLFGYYTWNLNSNPIIRNGIQDLIRNLLLWTASQPDDRRLVINPIRRSFDSIDPVLINAFLKDESGLQVSDGTVNMELNLEGGEPTSYSLNNDGLGKYSIDVGQLPEGLYNFQAVALRGSREIDRRTGQFSVSENVVEYTNTQRNDPLLRDLASSSGGMYLSWNQADDLIRELDRLNLKSPGERQVAFDWYPYRRIGWFLLALAFLTTEWAIRKYLAMP